MAVFLNFGLNRSYYIVQEELVVSVIHHPIHNKMLNKDTLLSKHKCLRAIQEMKDLQQEFFALY